MSEQTPRPPAPRHDIERRAYQKFEERGREEGRSEEDWFEAERELNSDESDVLYDENVTQSDSSTSPR